MTVRCEVDDEDILTVTLDDGDKNTLRPETFDALIAALDDHPQAVAVLLQGREGVLSAGLDLHWMMEHGRDGVERLLIGFGTCLMRWWTDPRPTVCAATGHAVAAGSMLAMVCDHAVATEGGFWGLTETRVGLEVPDFGIALARANLPPDRLEDLLIPGERIDAATAVAAGFADVLAPDDATTVSLARSRTEELAALPARAYAGTKRRLRGTAAESVLAGLHDDISVLTAHLA
ncbi:MAG: enoyl-CoA hydratase-related protein [Nitriliruptoraceae bacterium]